MLFFGVTVATGQVTLFAHLIFNVYGWDDIEPVTYLTGAFYAWVAFLFYFRYKGDWNWESASQSFMHKRYAQLCKKHAFEQSRIEFLERYRELLKLQIAYMEN